MKFKQDEYKLYQENEEGTLLAEIDYPLLREGVVDITRVFVEESLRGQGVAGQLMESLVSVLRKKHLKAVPSCPYAQGWFDKHLNDQDVLA